MVQLIESNLEFIEVLSAFPYLKDRLKSQKFNISDIKEGETINKYFEKKSYSEYEINIFIKKINNDIKYFLKNGKFPEKKSIEILKN